MSFTKTLPHGYENQYKVSYLLRHPPAEIMPHGTVTTTIGAYLGRYAYGGRDYDGKWEWMPLADYWAKPADVAPACTTDPKKREKLIESIGYMHDRANDIANYAESIINDARDCIAALEAAK